MFRSLNAGARLFMAWLCVHVNLSSIVENFLGQSNGKKRESRGKKIYWLIFIARAVLRNSPCWTEIYIAHYVKENYDCNNWNGFGYRDRWYILEAGPFRPIVIQFYCCCKFNAMKSKSLIEQFRTMILAAV